MIDYSRMSRENDELDEDLSLELSSGPILIPRLEGARLLTEFADVSQNVFKLRQALKDYWAYKSGGVRWSLGSDEKNRFDQIEAIVLEVTPEAVSGKPFPPVSVDDEAELRMVSIAAGVRSEGVIIEQARTTFLPHREVPQILDIGRQLEDKLDGEIVLFVDQNRQELSVVMNLATAVRSSRAKNGMLGNVLRRFWNHFRSDYPDWENVGPLNFSEIRSDLDRCLKSQLRTQYWRSAEGQDVVQQKIARFLGVIERTVAGADDVVKLIHPSTKEVVWACGWKLAAIHAGVQLPNSNDLGQLREFSIQYATGSVVEKFEIWMLSQFGSATAKSMTDNRSAILEPALNAFRTLVEREYVVDVDDDPGDPFSNIDEQDLEPSQAESDESKEVNPFA